MLWMAISVALFGEVHDPLPTPRVTPSTLIENVRLSLDPVEINRSTCRPAVAQSWRNAIFASYSGSAANPSAHQIVRTAETEFLNTLAPIVEDVEAAYDPIDGVYILDATGTRSGAETIDRELRVAFVQDQFWRGLQPTIVSESPPPDANEIVEALSLMRMCAVDTVNAAWMAPRLDQLLTSEAFESGTIRASFPLVLHADHDPGLQLSAIDTLLSAELSDRHNADRLRRVARLTDRLLLKQTNSQVFGTAWVCSDGDASSVGTLPELDTLTANREAFGLQPFSERRAEVEALCG